MSTKKNARLSHEVESIDSSGHEESASRLVTKRPKHNAQRPKRNPFISLEAAEGSEDDEDDEDEVIVEDQDVISHAGEAMSSNADDEEPGDIPYGSPMDYLSTNAEGLAGHYEKVAASQRRRARGDDPFDSNKVPKSVVQAILQPTTHDNEIWKVPLRTGHRTEEEETALLTKMCQYLIIWQTRFENNPSSNPPPRISSIFMTPSDPRAIFVECRTHADCVGFMSRFHFRCDEISLVELTERSKLLLPHAFPTSQPSLLENITKCIDAHVWVSTRGGTDIAYVLENQMTEDKYEVLRLPDLPSAGTQGGTRRRLLSFEDVKLLLETRRQKVADLPGNLFVLLNKTTKRRREFLGGLEKVEVPKKFARIIDAPDPQDLLPFVQARETSARFFDWVHETESRVKDGDSSPFASLKGTFFKSQEFEWLTADVLLQYADRFASATLDVGDRVEIRESAPTELRGSRGGCIVDAQNDTVQVKLEDDLVVIVQRCHARKTFCSGDPVSVINGPHKGLCGLVLAVEDPIVHVICGTMQELTSHNYQSSNACSIPIYSLRLIRSTNITMTVPFKRVEQTAIRPFEVGHKVIIDKNRYGKEMPGEVVEVQGQFYVVQTAHGSMVVEFSDLHPEQRLEPRSRRHWLVGKNVLVIYEHTWKGHRGTVRDVNIPNEQAIVQLSAQTINFSNANQVIPFQCLALDLSTTLLPRLAPVVPTPCIPEVMLTSGSNRYDAVVRTPPPEFGENSIRPNLGDIERDLAGGTQPIITLLPYPEKYYRGFLATNPAS
ncbi:hypothetical protein QCA50_002558 [Cerrena zonata]|uniref:Uncharacterized protein n=1 Tax=Cerrena zonata TaxID=2478898 RepID=A0AAW0GRU1_9APHY